MFEEIILFWRICHLDIFTDTRLTDITTISDKWIWLLFNSCFARFYFGVFVPLHNFYGVPQTSVPHVLWVRATLVPPAKFLRPVFFCVAKPIPQHSIDDDCIAKYSMLSHSVCLILVGFPEQKKNCCGGKIVSISSRGNCKLLNEEFTKTLFTPNTKKSLLKILRSQSFVNWPTNLIHSVTPLANGLDLGLKLFYGQKCDFFNSSFPLWEVARLNRRLAVAAFLVKTLHIFITRKP